MISETRFGEFDGSDVHSFVLDGGAGISLRVTDYGARLVELHVPDRQEQTADIVLGFDDLASYVTTPTYFGATCGRYGNRIRRGEFSLLGRDYRVDQNEGANHLHGGRNGWHRRVWDFEYDAAGSSITFATTSPDGEMGFPGACAVRSTYAVDGTSVHMTMEAVPDAPTVVNMVHHSYYNLAGHASGDVLTQLMRLPGDFYVPVDDELLATGEIDSVAGTPYDFRDLRPIGSLLEDLPPVGTGVFESGGGYDHSWCLRGASGDGLIDAAEIYDPGSGRRMVLRSSEPGVQMYTGGYLDEHIIGKGGVPYRQYAGFTLETQKFPDSPRFAHFPTSTVRTGDVYRHVMVLDFTVD